MPIDVYQSVADVYQDAIDNPLCYGILGPIGWLFSDCNPVVPNSIPPPIVSTPAAPRSVAEMKSGMWTPQDVLDNTWIKYKQDRGNQEAQMKQGGMYLNTPSGQDGDYSYLWLAGGLAIMGVLVIRGIVK